ncbi:MAG: hypothetical protein QNJ55_01015 [Xenococcus sp. MO_188.B8]|nr:hypothetical protein [Xenococcus sp. MO_188.B8]
MITVSQILSLVCPGLMSTAIRESKEQETGAEGAGAAEGAREVTHGHLD